MTMSLDEWRYAISRSFAPLLIHGDNETAPVFVRKLSEALRAEGITVRPLGM